MKQLNKVQTVVLLLGALLMVAGAGLYVFGTQLVAHWIFLVGAVCFASMQMMQTYSGNNFTIRRLRRIMVTGDVLFIVSALLMVENSYRLLLPLFLKFFPDGYNNYLTYIHNNWVLTLLVAAMIEIYSTHRISSELAKEAKKL